MHWIIQVEAKGQLRKIRNTALLQQHSHSRVLHSDSFMWRRASDWKKHLSHKIQSSQIQCFVQIGSPKHVPSGWHFSMPLHHEMRRCNAITPFLRWQRGVLPSSDLEMPPCVVFNPVTAAPVKRLRSAGRGKCTVERLQERTNGTASVPCPCREQRGWWAGHVQRVTEIYAGEVGIVVQLYMQT